MKLFVVFISSLLLFIAGCDKGKNDLVLIENGDTTTVQGFGVVFGVNMWKKYVSKGIVSDSSDLYTDYRMAKKVLMPDSARVKVLRTAYLITEKSETAFSVGENQNFVFVITEDGQVFPFDSFMNNKEKIFSLLGRNQSTAPQPANMEMKEEIQAPVAPEEELKQREIQRAQERKDSIQNNSSNIKRINPIKK